MATSPKKNLTPAQSIELIEALKARFVKNIHRHRSIDWQEVEVKLQGNATKLWSLHQMEATGGEPDVIAYDKKTKNYSFFDCAPESPIGRRSFCYDQEALLSRKENKPKNSAVNFAEYLGIDILTEEQYRALQELGKFDTKTSSWIKTPDGIRKLGGAIFADFRYGSVFVYHNGAESYYAARGFRGALKV